MARREWLGWDEEQRLFRLGLRLGVGFTALGVRLFLQLCGLSCRYQLRLGLCLGPWLHRRLLIHLGHLLVGLVFGGMSAAFLFSVRSLFASFSSPYINRFIPCQVSSFPSSSMPSLNNRSRVCIVHARLLLLPSFDWFVLGRYILLAKSFYIGGLGASKSQQCSGLAAGHGSGNRKLPNPCQMMSKERIEAGRKGEKVQFKQKSSHLSTFHHLLSTFQIQYATSSSFPIARHFCNKSSSEVVAPHQTFRCPATASGSMRDKVAAKAQKCRARAKLQSRIGGLNPALLLLYIICFSLCLFRHLPIHYTFHIPRSYARCPSTA